MKFFIMFKIGNTCDVLMSLGTLIKVSREKKQFTAALLTVSLNSWLESAHTSFDFDFACT